MSMIQVPEDQKAFLIICNNSEEAHTLLSRTFIMVKFNYTILQVLKKLDLAGRMVSYVMELSKYDIQYIPKGSIMLKMLVVFLVEFSLPTGGESPRMNFICM